MTPDLQLLFQIAGIGIVVAMLQAILKQMGKEDMALWATVIGFIVVLLMVIRVIHQLFEEIQTLFTW
jgi:stage III sporulation protein AC